MRIRLESTKYGVYVLLLNFPSLLYCGTLLNSHPGADTDTDIDIDSTGREKEKEKEKGKGW